MSTSAHECKSYLANNVARDIANSLFQKWAVKGFFPAGEGSEPRPRTARRAPAGRSPRREAGRAASGVAVPLAFFGTFFRFERKYSPLGAAAPPFAPESARHSPSWGFLTAGLSYAAAFAPCPLRAIPAQGSPIGTEMMRLRMR